MPGLVETHWHMWSSLGRNFVAEDFEYFPAKWATAALYEPDDFYRSVALGAGGSAQRRDHDGPQLVAQHPHARARRRRAVGPSRHPGPGPLRVRPPRRAARSTSRSTSPTSTASGGEWFDGGSGRSPSASISASTFAARTSAGRTRSTREMAEAKARRLPVAIHTVQGAATAVDATELERKGYLGPSFLIAHFLAATAERPGGAGPDAHAAELRRPLGAAPRRRRRCARGAAVDSLTRASTCRSRSTRRRIAPVDLFQAMNVAWNMGIPWEGDADCVPARADLPALPRDRDDRRGPRARARRRRRIAHAGQARRRAADPGGRPERRPAGCGRVGDRPNRHPGQRRLRAGRRHGSSSAADSSSVSTPAALMRPATESAARIGERAGGRLAQPNLDDIG